MDRITYEWRVTKMIDAAYKAKSFNQKTLIIKNEYMGCCFKSQT